MNIDGVKTAVVWFNDDTDPSAILGNPMHESEATCGIEGLAYDDPGFIGGWQSDGTNVHGVIWKEDGSKIELPAHTAVFGIDYYDGNVYSVGYSYENSLYSVKVWKNATELYTLSSTDNNGKGISIHVDAGDIYVAGWEGSASKIWKNGEEIQSMPVSGPSLYWDVQANSNGVYCAGQYNGQGSYWRWDGLQTVISECNIVYDMYVEELECVDNDAHTLPYFEGFENSATDWVCWNKIDFDDSNFGGFSYWHRSGTNADNDAAPATGNYCAWHGYNSATLQEGYLFSPAIEIPTGGAVTLSFMSYESDAEDYQYEGVEVCNVQDYQWEEVWHAEQSQVSAQWKKVIIDLSAYQGQEIMISFGYRGEDAHNWYIDDISITQEASSYYTITGEANPTEGGTVIGGGSNYQLGESCTLTAIPNTGYNFIEWSDGATENPHTITVTGNATYTAYFSQNGGIYEYTITAYASPVGAGMVEGTGAHPAGSSVTLIALPNPGYSFLRWDDNTTDNPRTFNLNNNMTIIAYFSGVGLDENGGSVVALYPNPAKESLHITGLEADSEVQIYNSLGMLVKVVSLGADGEIGISELGAGLYVARWGNVSLRFEKE